jgi:hypothetical protein
MVTIALGTTAPLVSETTPEIVDVASWASHRAREKRRYSHDQKNGIPIVRRVLLVQREAESYAS